MDPGIFSILVSLVFGGGIAAAITAFRKAGPEVESLSVTTLRGVIEELRRELDRKDDQITQCNQVIGELRNRVEKLEGMLIDPPPHLT